MAPRTRSTTAAFLLPVLALLPACSGSSSDNNPAAPAPSITSLAPAVGPSTGGNTCVIAGTDFVAGATVTFGGAQVSGPTVTSTSISLTVPAHAAGAVDVVVSNPDGQKGTKAGGYTYQAAAAPAVTSVSPATGPTAGGTTVTILGTNLVAGATVAFGGTTVAARSVTAGSIAQVVSPPHGAGAVDVVVTNPDGQPSNTLSGAFTYQAPPPPPAPTISAVVPASGVDSGGTTVTITGANFLAGTTVDFGGTTAAVTAVQSGAITAVTPAHAAGAVDVRVVGSNGTATQTAGFTFAVTPPVHGPAAVLTSVAPNAGSTLGGTTLVISGSSLDPGATVLVGGLGATVTGSAAGSLTVQTPPHAAGAVDVTVLNPTALRSSTDTLPGAFTYQVPPPPPPPDPTVTSVSPLNGPTAGGTTVTVTGTNFVTGASVAFGTTTVIPSSVTATSITVTTPAHAAGAVDVTVSNQDGSNPAIRGNAFTFDPPNVVLPVISSIHCPPPSGPASGPAAGGNACAITGTDFAAGATVTIGGALVTGPTITATSISVTVPAHALGRVDVTVTNPDGGVATLALGYTYLGPAPVIQAISVRGGPTAGGTQVTGVGTNIAVGVSVKVCDGLATVIDCPPGSPATFLCFVTPPHPEGLCDVVFTNPDLQAATAPGQFHYGPAPSISGLACSGGCDAVVGEDPKKPGTGDIITITGANFSAGAAVLFASVDTAQQALARVQSTSTTQLVVVAPKLDGGIPVRRYNIVVSNSDGQASTQPAVVTYK